MPTTASLDAKQTSRRHCLRRGLLVYCALWAVTALFGLPDIDRKFDVEFAIGTHGLAPPDRELEVLSVIRIPFTTALRDLGSAGTHVLVPDKPWRARSTGYAVAPFLVIDEVAFHTASLCGFSGHRLVFWFFGFSTCTELNCYWVS